MWDLLRRAEHSKEVQVAKHQMNLKVNDGKQNKNGFRNNVKGQTRLDFLKVIFSKNSSHP